MKKRTFAHFALALAFMPLPGAAQIGNAQGIPGTPPTFPSDRTKPGQSGPDTRLPSDPSSMPPDTKAPAPTSRELQQQIEQAFSKETELATSEIHVLVDKHAVTLTGTVDSPDERTLALRIAQSYAGERQVIDKLKLRS
jgi:BON domain